MLQAAVIDEDAIAGDEWWTEEDEVRFFLKFSWWAIPVAVIGRYTGNVSSNDPSKILELLSGREVRNSAREH